MYSDLNKYHILRQHSILLFIHIGWVGETGIVNISDVGEMGEGKTGVGKMGQIIGETGVGEMRVGEMVTLPENLV